MTLRELFRDTSLQRRCCRLSYGHPQIMSPRPCLSFCLFLVSFFQRSPFLWPPTYSVTAAVPVFLYLVSFFQRSPFLWPPTYSVTAAVPVFLSFSCLVLSAVTFLMATHVFCHRGRACLSVFFLFRSFSGRLSYGHPHFLSPRPCLSF